MLTRVSDFENRNALISCAAPVALAGLSQTFIGEKPLPFVRPARRLHMRTADRAMFSDL